jgi:hypothetical protein
VSRAAQLSPLGTQRLRLLDCLGGSTPRAPGYFAPPADANIFAAFHDHVAQMSRQWGSQSDPLTVSLLAAARLLIGEVDAAELIIDRFPARAVKLDHGAGICTVMPLYSLHSALPLPRELAETRLWLAGSPEQAALRAWLVEHRATLRWIEAEGVYKVQSD